MKDRLRGLTAGLRGAYDKHGAPAWGQYKNLVRGNTRGALVGLGLAAGYGAWSEGQNPISSSILLGPALMGAGAAIQAGGGWGMMKGVGRQVARDINTTIRTAPGTGANASFMSRTLPNVDYAGKTKGILDSIEGAVPMNLQYAAIAADLEVAAGEGRRVTLGEIAGSSDMGGFAGKYATPGAIAARAGESSEFAQQFATRAGDFKGVGGIGSMTTAAESIGSRYIGFTREGLVGRLRSQGQGALASEIVGMPSDVRVRGIGFIGSETISSLEYEMGGQSFRAPIVGPDGTIKSGLFGRNTNIARKQIFIGSLEGMAAGGTPQVLAMDVAVAKTLRTYHAAAKEVGQSGALVEYLGKMSNMPIEGLQGGYGLQRGMGTALSWTNPYRSSRTGVATSANVAIRGLDVQLTMPEDAGLRKAFNLSGFMDRDIVNAETTMMLRGRGFAPLGSESSVRSGSFVNTGQMAKLFPGSYMTPMDKAARGIRDYTKPYFITGGGALRRRPFASAALNKAIPKSQGLAMHYNAILESEADFLSELLNTGRRSGSLNPNINKVIEGIMGESMTGGQLREMRGALSNIANMREGQFAAAIPSSAMMVTEKEALLATLPSEVAGLSPGSSLPSNTAIGFDASNKPVYHGYSKLGGGTARLQSIEALKDGGRTSYLVRWAEEQSAANVKYGSDVGKMFNISMKESQTPLVMRFINKLRRNKSMGKRLYSNAEYAPLMGAVDNAVQAFTLAGTFGKVQGGPEILASTLAESFMPSMSSGGKKQLRKMLRRNRMSLQQGGGIVSRFRNGNDIAAAHSALMSFSDRLVRSPQAFGLRPDVFGAIPQGMSGGATILMRGGIVSESMAWDALNLNVPTNTPISANQLNIMGQYGMKNSVTELLGRRKLSGDAKMTEAYKIALGQYVTPGAKMSSNMPVINLKDWQTSLGAAQWRGSERVQQNFIIDLEIAGKQLDAATLKRTLGVSSLKIPVPGVGSDFWREPYRTASGTAVSSETWTGPLNRLLRSVEDMYNGDVKASSAARGHLTDYFNKIRSTDSALSVGRGGRIYDAGANIAGRISHRDYSRLYKGHSVLGGRASGFLVGINPEDFGRLGGGSGEYAAGVLTRFPATTVDPVFMIPDKSVARGEMAFDETLRALRGADNDGDTAFVSLVKDKGSVKEVEDIVRGRGANAAAFDEAYQARALLGGVSDDLAVLGAASRGGSRFGNVAQKVTERLGKFIPVSMQSEGTLLAKSYTQYIGRFSNLANEYIMASSVMNPSAALGRAQLLRDIQQASIDFGRKSSGKINPADISDMLGQAIKRAAQGDIDGANGLFAGVMERLSVGDEIEKNLDILRSSYANDTSKIAGLETLAGELQAARTGFFNPLRGKAEMQAEFGQVAEAQNLFNKSVYTTGAARGSTEGVRDAMLGVEAHLGAQVTLADQGVASIGRGSAGSASQITGMNRATAAAKGTSHILKDAWQTIRSSPHFSTARAGLMVTGGLIVANALFNSPSDLKPPPYKGSQRSMMMSPDVGMAGMSGAPMPGSGGGHVARGGEMRNPRRVNRPAPPQNTIPRRYYVNQTNRVPRVRYSGSGDPYDSNLYATEVSSQLQRMAGGSARINVVHDATSRRMSELEFQDKMREDLRGGR